MFKKPIVRQKKVSKQKFIEEAEKIESKAS